MNIVRNGEAAASPATSALFLGSVTSAPLVTGDSLGPNVSLIRFINGGRNVWHVHTATQVLYFVEGHGIVATAEGEHGFGAGDIAQIPAGEVHWHGAQPGQDAAHLSIMLPGQTSIVDAP